ncbi:MAG: hypothetical protein V3V29_00940 [Acidimicrobiia bacterium]
MPNTFTADPGPEESTSGSRVRKRLATTAGRRRIVGGFLLAGLLATTLGAVDPPTLDTVRDDVAVSASADLARRGVPARQVSNCFQGFCYEEGAGMLRRWWDFSTTYLELIAAGVMLAALAAGVADAFLFPTERGPAWGRHSAKEWWRSRRVATLLELQSSAVLPARGLVMGAVATGVFNAPALAMVVVLFSPGVIGLRVGLGLIALVLIRWLVPVAKESPNGMSETDRPSGGEAPWSEVIRDGLIGAGIAAWRFLLRLAPAFVLVAFVGGLGTQYLTEAGVAAVAGNHMLGVILAAAVGLLVSAPLALEIPLVAAGLLLGIGWVPAGVLLFAAAASGSVTVGDLARRLRHREVVAFLLVILATSSIGGGAGLVGSRLAESSVPTVAFDGETCAYSGPAHFGPQVVDFVVRNETEDAGDGHTMAVVVGRLPDNVSIDHFAAEVHAAPTSPLPGYFTMAGTDRFVFPGTEQIAQITLHQAGTYAAVCLNGGGFYVIFEFSMPQPMGWFDEFQSTFTQYVAPVTFTVAG